MHSLIATLAICLLAAQAPGLDNANAASFDDAPTVRENEMFKAAIVVRNPYDRAVKVKQLDASCSCAELDIHDHLILPGQASIMDVAVKCANRSGDQSVHVSVYVTDPEFEPIEVDARWKVRACVQVDAVAPGADPKVRPTDAAWQDIYRYIATVRPDEPNTLRKRIRLSCPEGEVPAGGLKVTGVDYDGKLWQFSIVEQEGGSVLILAKAKDGLDPLPEGEYHEQAIVHTNHPDKRDITLHFESLVAKNIGSKVGDIIGAGNGATGEGKK